MDICFDPTLPTLEETVLECDLPLLPVLFECDVLGLDVGDIGISVKCIADSDGVCLISYGVLDDGFRSGLCVYRDDGSNSKAASISGKPVFRYFRSVLMFDG